MSRITRLVLTALFALAVASPAAAQCSACVAGLRDEAQESGVPGDLFDLVMRGVVPDP